MAKEKALQYIKDWLISKGYENERIKVLNGDNVKLQCPSFAFDLSELKHIDVRFYHFSGKVFFKVK